jgi:hypothetical protein
MKYLIILSILINSALACQLSIPESYIPTFLNPPVSGHYMKCEEKPEEKCFCIDNVNPYTSELLTEITQDELGINVETKVLKQTESKKAAYEASLQAIKDAEELAIANKEVLKLSCREEIKTADTLEKLRALYEKCFEGK